MIVISATEFRAKCLEFLDRAQAGELIRVTKRGKVVAEVGAPHDQPTRPLKAGLAKGEMTTVGDIVFPLDIDWDALK